VFVRWDNLKIDHGGEEEARLAGYRDPAVVRRFDAPEAMDIRFYEVRAKSALNRVPERSAMPFRWTINPYRGCTHACVFCASGDTAILLANGRTKPLGDLRAGDAIVGTTLDGKYRRYVETTVHDHWATIKPAYRVRLEDGSELITSGDHRFLSRRGWKHVIGAMGGPLQRPYLTPNDSLLGTGGFVAQPKDSADYRRGYLCGVIRGDGYLASSNDPRPGSDSTHHRPRLAPIDEEALQRTQRYLRELGVATTERVFQRAVGTFREVRAVGYGARASDATIGDVPRWPLSPSDDWRKGFLAGIFDAEGASGHHTLRIATGDRTIVAWTRACLAHFGFDVLEEPTKRADGVTCIRIRGGLRERLRFLHLTDPAITRKRTVQGMALEPDARTRVAAIEPLGVAMRLYDITTGTGDYISNGVVSHNCFARPTHTYLDMDAGRDFEREIVVKVNAPEVVRAELSRPSWTHEHVAMGTNTDPYQWVEGRYKLMPGIWEAFRDTGTPCSILTKSPLLLRDLPLMLEIRDRGIPITANLSVPTLDEKMWRATEPHTPSPRARLEAVGELNRAGIPTGILIAPLMPGINDSPEQVERIIEIATENGATGIGGITLHLRGEVRGIFFDWLRAHRPDLIPMYERLYARGAYAPQAERERLAAMVRRGIGPPSPDDGEPRRGASRVPRRPVAKPEPPSPKPRQDALF
jgi:DNA repair photolyase